MRTQKAFSLALTLILSGCSPKPQADVTIQQHEQSFDFQFHTRGIIGLMSLTLWSADTKQILWHVNLNYYNEHTLRYGHVPSAFTTFNGAKNSATENSPALPLPPNQRFYLAIETLHHAFPEPALRASWFSFATDNKGIIGPVKRAGNIPENEKPNQMQSSPPNQALQRTGRERAPVFGTFTGPSPAMAGLGASGDWHPF